MSALQIALIVCGVLVVALFVAPVIACRVKARSIEKKQKKIVDDFFKGFNKF